MHRKTLIITAASSSYGSAVLALPGSLHSNWPGHPPESVYDIGQDEATLKTLARHGAHLCARGALPATTCSGLATIPALEHLAALVWAIVGRRDLRWRP